MQNSKIEWTHHTFNPWWGCQRVSAGCQHCYAETLAHRYNYRVWGPAKTTERRQMSANYWKQPYKWNKAAAEAGERHRVFCASMADVFEDHPQVSEWRADLMRLIDDTPHLDWLLLTKRPQNVMPFLRDTLNEASFPPNVWIGTSVEDQAAADERIPHLLSIPARVRFLSCEPLLGPVDLSEWLRFGELTPYGARPIHWVIVGGESGHGARPMHPDWARSLRDQCQAAGVAFFFKQWGEYAPRVVRPPVMTAEGLIFSPLEITTRMGKAAAGRVLDGRTWDEFPA
jgi:protein gp37